MQSIKPNLVKVDLHCHTEFSSDSIVSAEEMIRTRKRKGLDKIAITDHNTIAGALIAKELDPDGIIVGEEINTLQGELIAYYVKEEIPPDLSAEETIKELKKQGAYISVSHPFDKTRGRYWTEESLLKIIDDIDAVEGFNSRVLTHSKNVQALEFAKRNNISFTVGSDSHSRYELGRAYMTITDFSDAEGLRQALKTPDAKFRYSPVWVRLFSRYANLMHKLKKD